MSVMQGDKSPKSNSLTLGKYTKHALFLYGLLTTTQQKSRLEIQYMDY